MREFVVKENKLGYVTGIFGIGVGLAVLVLSVVYDTGNSTAVWFYLLVILLFGLPSAYLIMSGKNRRLEVLGQKLCYVNFLNHKKQFSIKEVGYATAIASSGYLNFYNKSGKSLCKIDASMHNVYYLILYLMDNEITIELKGNEKGLANILSQRIISLEELGKYAEKIYEDTGEMVEKWKERNQKTGASIQYGFSEYCCDSLSQKAELQPLDARCKADCLEDIPKDYLCVIELYLKKDEKFIRNKKGSLVMLSYPVMYRRESLAADRAEVLIYDGAYKEEIEEQLKFLESYLPRHKFIQEVMELPCPLKRSLNYKIGNKN